MTKLNPHIFRAYDVRGLLGDDVNPEVFRQVGAAYATLIRRQGGRTIAVGQDNRLSSGGLKASFVEGARGAGIDVIDVGLTPTPLLYFATAHWRLDGGANITGSHNPIEYNGVKMVHPGAAPLTEDEIQSLRVLIETRDFTAGHGTLTARSPRADYLDTVARLVRPARSAQGGRRRRQRGGRQLGDRMFFVASAARWSSCIASRTGPFPITCPTPRTPSNMRDLQVRVVATGADLGLAYDGDADRVGVIDERGRRHEADLILVLLARDLLRRHPGAKIVFDVKSSQALVDDITRHGGVPVMWKTGHSHLKRKMREEGILLGGEVSGHMFFAEDYYGVDDGILASAKIVEIAAGTEAPISKLFDSVPHLQATPELKAPCPDGEKFRVIDQLVHELRQQYETIDIDGARVLFPGGGWGLVRASNTNPYLTLRFEAHTEQEIADMKRVIYGALRRYPLVSLPE